MVGLLTLLAFFSSSSFFLSSFLVDHKIDENFVTGLAFIFVAIFVEGLLVAGSVSSHSPFSCMT